MTDKHDEDDAPVYIKKIRGETKLLREQGIKEEWGLRPIRLGQGDSKDEKPSSAEDENTQ